MAQTHTHTHETWKSKRFFYSSRAAPGKLTSANGLLAPPWELAANVIAKQLLCVEFFPFLSLHESFSSCCPSRKFNVALTLRHCRCISFVSRHVCVRVCVCASTSLRLRISDSTCTLTSERKKQALFIGATYLMLTPYSGALEREFRTCSSCKWKLIWIFHFVNCVRTDSGNDFQRYGARHTHTIMIYIETNSWTT